MKLPARNSALRLLPILAVVSIAILFAGYGYYLKQKAELERNTEDQLNAIADLKVSQITRWRQERMNDAMLVQNNPAVVEASREFLSHPDSQKNLDELVNFTNSLKLYKRYSRITLLNVELEPQFSTPPSEDGPNPVTRGLARIALAENRVMLSDLHRETAPDRVSMEICIPLRERSDARNLFGTDIGVLVIEIDPFEFLFPQIQSWPTPSKSAETLLIRREGNDIRYLNQLKHRADTALVLRINAMQNPRLIATHAILGHKQLARGLDYRGVPTLGVGRKIPDSPWYLVAKVDQEEILSPLRDWLQLISITTVVLVLGVCLGVFLLWQRREVHFARHELEEHAKAEAALKRSNSLLEATLESTADGILVADLARRITNYNDRFVTLWNMPRAVLDESNNKEAYKCVLSQVRNTDTFLAKIAEMNSQPEADSFDVVELLDGRTFERYSHPQRIDGIPVGRVWSFRDITQRRRAELERERLTMALERKNEDLENLIYAASHDLRSPLVNIEGFSRRLEKAYLELSMLYTQLDDQNPSTQALRDIIKEQMPKSVGYIRSGVAKMNALINGLLQISRLGQVAIHEEDLNMASVLTQICTTMAFQIQKTGANVMIGTLPRARGDAQLINQVFSNLFDNALKYRDPNRPLIIQVTGYEQEGKSIFCVEDNGIGIAEEHQDKIWEMFHRLNPGGSIAGEGIGLNLVKSILDKHLGQIRLESTPGKGSRFYVSLPGSQGML